MAFPTTGTIDNCTRADENPLSNSGLWNGAVAFTADFTMKLLTNQVQAAGASFGSCYTTASYGPDCELYVACAGTDFGQYNILRLANPGASVTGYMVFFDAANNQITLQRIDNSSTFVTLAGPTTISAYASTAQMGASMVGSTLTAYIDGVAKLTATDSTYSAAGKLGLRKFSTQMPITSVGGGTIVPSTSVTSVAALANAAAGTASVARGILRPATPDSAHLLAPNPPAGTSILTPR